MRVNQSPLTLPFGISFILSLSLSRQTSAQVSLGTIGHVTKYSFVSTCVSK